MTTHAYMVLHPDQCQMQDSNPPPALCVTSPGYPTPDWMDWTGLETTGFTYRAANKYSFKESRAGASHSPMISLVAWYTPHRVSVLTCS